MKAENNKLIQQVKKECKSPEEYRQKKTELKKIFL